MSGAANIQSLTFNVPVSIACASTSMANALRICGVTANTKTAANFSGLARMARISMRPLLNRRAIAGQRKRRAVREDVRVDGDASRREIFTSEANLRCLVPNKDGS